jgi:transcriptional regulator with XRE-family HTH domain
MPNLNLEVLGSRLKRIREELQLSQEDVAFKVNCKQNAISNLELGKGGSIAVLLSLLSFYSSFFFIDLIFSEDFYFIARDQMKEQNSLTSMAFEMFDHSTKDFMLRQQVAITELSEDFKLIIQLLRK